MYENEKAINDEKKGRIRKHIDGDIGIPTTIARENEKGYLSLLHTRTRTKGKGKGKGKDVI